MESKDKYIAVLAILTAGLLGTILFGAFLPSFARTIITGIGFYGFIGIAIQVAIPSTPAAVPYRRWFARSSVILIGLFTSLAFLDQRYHGEAVLILGMEPATAMLVFGLTLWPFSYVALWVIGFDTAMLPLDQRQRIDREAASKPESDPRHG